MFQSQYMKLGICIINLNIMDRSDLINKNESWVPAIGDKSNIRYY